MRRLAPCHLQGFRQFPKIQRPNVNTRTTKPTDVKPTSYCRERVSFANGTRQKNKKNNNKNPMKENLETLITLLGKWDDSKNSTSCFPEDGLLYFPFFFFFHSETYAYECIHHFIRVEQGRVLSLFVAWSKTSGPVTVCMCTETHKIFGAHCLNLRFYGPSGRRSLCFIVYSLFQHLIYLLVSLFSPTLFSYQSSFPINTCW